MDFSTVEQRSEEWHEARLGKVTASRVADMMARTKSGPSASRKNYRAELVLERLTGQRREGFTNAAMQWGTDVEPHLRRWERQGARWAVEYQGGRVGDIKKAWSAARTAAGLPADVTPHTMRHTAITWALQGGARTWDVAGYFGVSIKVIEEVYGHHSADHQSTARAAMEGKR